jgi:hypothetical protein
MTNTYQHSFVKGPSDKLKTQRETLDVKTRGQTESGETHVVKGPIITSETTNEIVEIWIVRKIGVSNSWNRDRNGRGMKQIRHVKDCVHKFRYDFSPQI